MERPEFVQPFSDVLAGSQSQLQEHLSAAFRDLSARLESTLNERTARAEHTGRSAAANAFNQAARCLRQAENHEQWVQALLDAAAQHAARVALFSVVGDTFVLKGTRGIPPEIFAAQPIDTKQAPALAAAADSVDTVVALRTAGEFSTAITDAFAGEVPRKVYLIPLPGRRRALGVLYAEAGESAFDLNALELITSIAGATLEQRRETAMPDLIAIGNAPEKPASTSNTWTALSTEERQLHLRAQRFARTAAAQLRLNKAADVLKGRADKNLYELLQVDIDSAREKFRSEFFANSSSMVDYLHLELVHTIASDDQDALGNSYPGPLVA